jgi:cobalt-zinc-cadmium efflux system membrane fusion protein
MAGPRAHRAARPATLDDGWSAQMSLSDTPIKQGGPEKTPGAGRPGTVFVLVLIGIAAAIGSYRYFGVASNRPAQAQAPAPAPNVRLVVRTGSRISIPEGSPVRGKVTVEAVQEKDDPRKVVLPAVVEADPAQIIKVLPPLTGRITKLEVQLGQRVKNGQALAILDSPDLAAAYADYDKAKVLFELARKFRERLRGLNRIGGAALKDLQQAETDYITAEVEFQRADAHLKQIGVEAEPASKVRTVTVSAPRDGSVIDLAAAQGTFWNDTTAALMTLADLSSVWVTANVPEKDTSFVKERQNVEVVFSAFPDEVHKGTVDFVSDVLDPDTRRIKVRIRFENPNIRFKPNMFANVTFLGTRERLPSIPTSALILKSDRNQQFVNQVLVEVEPWTFEPRTVDILFQQDGEVFIKGGVKAGDRVIVKGGVLLND